MDDDVSEEDAKNNSMTVDWISSFRTVPAAKDKAEKMIDELLLAMED